MGTIDEFEKYVNETHGDDQHGQCYKHLISVAKIRIGGE